MPNNTLNPTFATMLSKFLLLSLVAATVKAAPVGQTNNLEDCPTDGAIVCGPTGDTFFMCNWGRAVPMGQVASGMKCVDGKIVAMDSSFQTMSVPPNSTSGSGGNPAPEVPVPTQVEDPSPIPSTIRAEDPLTTTEYITTNTRVVRTSVIIVTATRSDTPVGTSMDTAPTSDAPTSAAPTSGTPIPISSEPESESTAAVPTATPTGSGPGDDTGSITADIILEIAPGSSSCAGASFQEECRTAVQAAPFVSKAFSDFNINTIGERAALLSLMIFESGNFQFNRNHYPGRPGQGTKAMLMPNFIVSYAQSFGSTDSIQAGLNAANIDSASDSVKNEVLALVLGDDKTFASAAWFYSENCSDTVKSALRGSPSIAAWSSYITECVGASVEGREEGFRAAVAALGGTVA
ncbi:hypothetical protein ABW19_dt0201077 [Dactylella cylindrospora]|nr:hypothetical protein ABW19_dt0201077 [Dactylella cylindrospora]